jgi:hypothetical protein
MTLVVLRYSSFHIVGQPDIDVVFENTMNSIDKKHFAKVPKAGLEPA